MPLTHEEAVKTGKRAQRQGNDPWLEIKGNLATYYVLHVPRAHYIARYYLSPDVAKAVREMGVPIRRKHEQG